MALTKRFALTMESGLKFLLFLFPVLAVSVKSWASAFHLLLFVLAVIAISSKQWRMNKFELSRDEKIFLGLMVLIYIWYLLVEYVNGWQGVKSHWPWIDFRYVMIIPIYLAVRRIPDSHHWLLRGGALCCIIAALHSGYQSLHLSSPHPMGAYHHLFIGPVSAAFSLLLMLSQPAKWNNGFWRLVIYSGIVSGFVALMFSTARSGMLALLVVLFFLPFLINQVSTKKLLGGLILGLFSVVLLFHLFAPFKKEVLETYDGVLGTVNQFSLSKEAFHRQELDNITSRIEMWRSAVIISAQNPVFGTGRYGYAQIIDAMVSSGDGHPWMKGITLPHSAYLYHSTMRGMPGLLLFLLLLAWPVVMVYRRNPSDRAVRNQVIVWVLFFAVVGLTQSSVFSRGHYLSVFMVTLAVLLSAAMQQQKSGEQVGNQKL